MKHIILYNKTVTNKKCNALKYIYQCHNCRNIWYSSLIIKSTDITIKLNNDLKQKLHFRYNGYLDQCPRCIGDRKQADIYRKENKLRKQRTDIKPIWVKRKTNRDRVRRWRKKQIEVKKYEV